MTDQAVDVLYFAWIREAIGQDGERLNLPPDVSTTGALLEYLVRRGGGYKTAFADTKKVRVAVNQDHVDMDHVLNPGDEVAFFPPVTGG